jgi:hypothetical protein
VEEILFSRASRVEAGAVKQRGGELKWCERTTDTTLHVLIHTSMEPYSAHCNCLLCVQVALRVTAPQVSVKWVEEGSVSKEITTSYDNKV